MVGLWDLKSGRPTIWKQDIFVWILNGFWQNGSHLSWFQMVGLPDFRSHSKSGPFATQLIFDHKKSRLVRISDHLLDIIPFYLVFRCPVMSIYQSMIWIADNFVCYSQHNLINGPFDLRTNALYLSTRQVHYPDPLKLTSPGRVCVPFWLFCSLKRFYF